MPRNILVITLLILALLALGATTFYLTLKEKSEKMEKEERVATLPEEPVVESQEPTTLEAIDTSDWKSYSGYGISFKYPSHFKVESRKGPRGSFCIKVISPDSLLISSEELRKG